MISFKIIKGFGGADKTYRADGNKVVLVAGIGVVFLDNISYKTQIMYYKLIPRRVVSLGYLTYTFCLVLGGKLARKLVSPLKVQPENQKVLQCEFYKQADHNKSSQNYPTKYYTLRQAVVCCK